ncbi:hypothetical protein TNCV_4903481 [Trichonephila clavipes]|uniref:Uncharacterized protein n=1 Tax=Trichonephila clavipes TaxID=2585209 RepID=A0A8X6S5Y6_TRICX|nr:hypothetical protein TNCV_4903481 [Trichonephila clavipes]
MVSNGTEFAVRDIEKLFDEAIDETLRQNTKSGRNIMIDGGKMFRLRKSDEMEIRTSSPDNKKSSYKSINFEGMQPRSNSSLYSRMIGSGERRELEEKGTGLLRRIRERHTSIASNRRPLVRSSPGS